MTLPSRVLCAVLSLVSLAPFAPSQSSSAPVFTPQLNTDLYVGQIGYPTIQSTVSRGCNMTGNGFRAVIQAGVTPADTIAQVSGCAKVVVVDQRSANVQAFFWNTASSAYVAYTPVVPPPVLDATAQLNNVSVLEYPNTTRSPLASWLNALEVCRSQVVKINVYADSRSLQAASDPAFGGYGTLGTIPASWSGRWISRLDAQLKRKCGSHGSGIQPLRWGTGTFNQQGLNEYMYSYTSGVAGFTATDTSLGPVQGSDPMLLRTATDNNNVGYFPQMPDGSGNLVAPTGAAPYPVSTLPYDHLRLYAVSGPGLNPWTMYIDGTAVGTCGGSGASEAVAVCSSSAVKLGTHSSYSSCPTHPCGIYAMEAVAGTTGAAINNFAIGSSSLEAFVSTPSNYAFELADPDGPAQLHIVNHVTNEINQGVSLGTFQASLATAVSHAAAQSASLLLIANSVDGLTAAQPIAPFYTAIRAAAQTSGAALLDMRDRWGYTQAPLYLFGPDTFHENNMGNGGIFSATAATIIDDPFAPSTALACPQGSAITSMDPFGGFVCSAPGPVPVEAWPLNDGSGLTFANSVNPTHPSTATGITWGTTTGFSGSTPTFSGGATATAAANSATFVQSQPFTVCAWMRPTSFNTLNEVYSDWTAASGGFEFYLYNDGSIRAYLTDTSGNNIGAYTAAAAVPLNTVTHACAVYSGSATPAGFTYYVNGASSPVTATGGNASTVGTITAPRSIYFALNPASARSSFAFNGQVKFLRVYSTALTPSQVAALYAAGQQ